MSVREREREDVCSAFSVRGGELMAHFVKHKSGNKLVK